MARTVYHLVHKNIDDRWHLETDGKDVAVYGTKREAEEGGRERCKNQHGEKIDSQLVIHRADGSIETEYTYGHDPRHTPG